MTLNLRYSTQLKGAIVFTGNTLMLSQDTNVHLPGVQGSGGTFISRNLANQVGTYPPGTTLNYLENGSEAQLVLPPGSTVVRAELVWGGIYEYNYQNTQGNPGEVPSSQSIVGLINNPVFFNGIQINPDPATAHTEGFTIPTTGNSVAWYERSADVTSIVQSIGVGTYYTEQVPALIEPMSNYTGRTEHAGWSLAVVYSNPAEDFKNLYLWNGGELISNFSGPTTDINISGFETVPSGPVNAKFFLSAQEGDADIAGDSVLFGPNTGSLTTLSGPNNAITNFFGGQINNSSGTIDTSGTFGTMNNNVFTNTNYFGGRHGWDITAMDVSPQMQNSQTSAVIRITTAGDAYMVNMIGLETDAVLVDVPVVKSVDKAYADIGDVLTYSFSVTNNSNLAVDTLNFTDAIPNGTAFVPNSVYVNSVQQIGANPASGIALPNMNIADVTTISFQVTVTAMPNPNPIPNSANLTFFYQGSTLQTSNSNTVNTLVSKAILNSVKSVDLAYAQPGQTLTYSTVLSNTGSTNAQNVVFTDAIPIGTTLIANSVTVAGSPVIGADPSVGVNVGTIPAGGSVLVTFNVLIGNVIPTPNPILNSNTTAYQYSVNPADPLVTGVPVVSNTVSTLVKTPIISIVKAVDKATALLGDTLTYTTTITNTGNVAADSVQFNDLMPNGTTFVTGSVILNGTPQPSANPALGMNIGSIAVNGTSTIVFKATVNTGALPNPNPIPNNNGAGYSFVLDPAQPPIVASPVISNTVNTLINDVIISGVKSVNKAYADIGDTLLYTVVVSNSGNLVATNVNFQDNIPAGTTFVPNSVTINGSPQTGFDPQAGFNIPSIPASGSVTITFSVTINSILPLVNTIDNVAVLTPTGKPAVDTNTVTTTLNHAQIQVAKVVNETFATTGQTLTYTNTVSNVGNTTAENVIFTDAIPSGTTFVAGSVIVNGIPQPAADPSVGINIGNLVASAVATVEFSVLIGNTVPTPNPIPNTSNVNYAYVVDPANPAVQAPTANSNTVNTTVNIATLTQVKSVSKTLATWGDQLLYTIVVSNSGNVDATNVNFIDLIPAGTTFVANSVSVANVNVPGANPSVGFNIGTVPAGGSVTVSFNVTVNNATPVPNPIPNNSTVTFNYLLDPSKPPVSGVPNQSNTVNTTVNKANLTIVKSESQSSANLGDTVQYTLVVTNDGNVQSTNGVLTDIVPVGTTFVPASVVIDGIPSGTANPAVGINIPDLAPGASTTVVFSVQIGAVIPTPNPMPNTGTVDYKYIVDPTKPANSDTATSNTVNLLVVDAGNSANFTIVKSVNKAVALVGDTLNYTVTMTNTGTTQSLNTILKDIVPVGTTFVAGTVVVDGTAMPLADPAVGINIGTVAVGQSVQVDFSVIIGNTIPTPNPMVNTANLDYDYRTNPNLNPPVKAPTQTSNPVDTLVKTVNIQTVKSVDLSYAKLNQILTYKIGVANTGTANAVNVVVTDIAPAGTTFVAGSVIVDGIPDSLANIETGVTIPSVIAGQVVIVEFKVQVGNTFPVPNPIVNTGDINYQYIVDPANPPIQGTPVTTNSVNTTINEASLNIVKAVDKTIAKLGDILSYTTTITNTGNTAADQVILTDLIPADTTFVTGTVIVNGIPQPAADPSVGVNIGSIASGASSTVIFEVKIGNTIPVQNPIPNNNTASYQYILDPSKPPVIATPVISNTVNTQVNDTIVSAVKSVNKSYVDIGDTVVYTVVLTNNGNISASNINFQDTIPAGTTFVPNSVTINGTTQVGYNPQTGFVIANIPVGGNATVTFAVTVDATLPLPNVINNMATITEPGKPVIDTNVVTTNLNHAQIQTVKQVDATIATIGQTISYTSVLSNVGNSQANNVIFTDSIPAGTTFVPGSIYINNVNQPSGNPANGINVGSIAVNGTVSVKFSVMVGNTLPTPNPILNTSQTGYTYSVDPSKPDVTAPVVNSNQVSTQVDLASLSQVKAVDKAIASWGDTLTYTVTVSNTGNVSADNVIFKDLIPSGTTFVTDSVIVDGVPQAGYNPSVGFNIGTIVAAASSIVTFKVTVNNATPLPNPILNSSNVTFNYIADSNKPPVNGIPNQSNIVDTTINRANLVAVKSESNSVVKLGDQFDYTIVVTNTGNVQSINGVLTDAIPADLTFVAGTVIIDGTPAPSADPVAGINLPTINAGVSKTVKFTVKAPIALPTVNPIPNSANVDYEYVVDPINPPKAGTTTTNVVDVLVIDSGDSANFTLNKAVDKAVALVGDTLNYTITFTNTGTTEALNTVLTDLVPSGTTYVSGTLKVDGIASASDPSTGVNIGTVAVNQTVVVIFSVKIGASIPNPNPVPNSANLNYEFRTNPSLPPITAPTKVSNIVDTLVKNVNVTASKSVNFSYSNLNSQLTYTILVSNLGTADATNVVIKDTVPNGTTFVTGSVIVNGIAQPLADIQTGVTIASLPAGSIIPVTFKVQIGNTIPNPNPIVNNADVNYNYIVDPTQNPIPGLPITTNDAITNVNQANLVIVKAVDKTTAILGDVLTYTTTITNTGNIAASDVVFTDLIPAGTSFVTGSVVVNGTPEVTFDPALGISLGTIAPLAASTVIFKVKVDSVMPAQNPIVNNNSANYDYTVDPSKPPITAPTSVSNIVNTTINDIVISAIKTVNKAYADVSDTLVYTVNVTNSGNITATAVNFKDNIPQGTSFVQDSVIINGIAQAGLNPQNGFTLPDIAAGSSVSVSFSVKINSTLPIPSSVTNAAIITPPGKPPVTTTPVTTNVNHAQIQITKQNNAAFATTGQTISYTSVVQNVGNTVANNVIFTDLAPQGTTFVPGTVYVDNVNQPAASPISGINLGSIVANGSVIVKFNVVVGDTVPTVNPVINIANANYSYTVDPKNPDVIAPQVPSNPVSTMINKASLDQIKSVSKTSATWGDTLVYSVLITNTGNVDATNVNFIDISPSGTTFVPGSVVVAGNPVPLADPNVGVNVGTIAAGGNVTVKFSVTVNNSIPAVNPIPNRSVATFKYLIDPSQAPISGNPSQSNIVETTINKANLVAVKSESASVVNLGDTFSYSILVTNYGNVNSTNAVLTDIVPVGTTFVPGSVVVAGNPSPSADPSTGINLPDLAPNASVTVGFNVTVGGLIPTPNPMPNTASINYKYVVDPTKPLQADQATTNTVNTLVVNAGNYASFTLSKAVDKAIALVGDTLTYTMTFTNTGTTESLDTVLTDIVPVGTTFVTGSVVVNGVSKPAADPLVGINVGTVAVNAQVIVKLQVKIGQSVPTPNPMPNSASLNYNFRTNPNLNPPVAGPTKVSNIVTTLVKNINIQARKEVNLSYSTVNGMLTYTIGIGNTGTAEAINVLVQDIVPSGAAFVPGSVTINGVSAPSADVNAGITIPSIMPGEIVLIAFNAQIGSTIPTVNPLLNNATVNYQYIVDPVNPPINGIPVTTNTVSTTVNKATVVLSKAVDKVFADVNSVLTYTINAKNTGNVDATNVVVTDIIPSGTTFIPDSIKINGIAQVGGNPSTGITIPLISAGQTIPVVFAVKVGNTVPTPNPIPNVATAQYSFKINPDGSDTTLSSSPSNPVKTQINHGQVSITKAVDNTFIDVNQQLTYTFNLVSVGNVDSNNVVLTDLIPSGTSFVANSVTINGVVQTGIDPANGISIGTVSTTPILVSFKVLVGNTVPKVNPITNLGTINYSYLVDPSAEPVKAKQDSNTVSTLVNHAEIKATKIVDKSYVNVNGVINYTTILRNIGSATALNVIFTDILAPGVSFIANSLSIDGNIIAGADPQVGVLVGDITAGHAVPISFAVQVSGSIPTPNPILNSNTTSYSYVVKPGSQAIVAPPAISNIVSTQVNNATISSVKSVDKAYGDIGEVIEYKIVLTNTGNVVAQNVIFTDIIPAGTTLVGGSFTVDGQAIIGANPSAGVSIANIPAGGTKTIMFSVKVQSEGVPSPNPVTNSSQTNFSFLIDPEGGLVNGNPSVSNNVQTQINNAQLVINKVASQAFADLGDVISYTFSIENIGNVPANNVYFKDLLQAETNFVSSSVVINGVKYPLYNPINGFNLGTIPAKQKFNVVFNVIVASIPSNNVINNIATAKYTHIVDPTKPEKTENATSNQTQIVVNHGEILPSGLVKSANKSTVTDDDTITYTIKATNSGNVSINNVVINDALPNGVTFIAGTVTINGTIQTNQDPSKGITLGTIGAGITDTITFKVKVNPQSGTMIVNEAIASYNYVVNPNNPPVSRETVSNIVLVNYVVPKVKVDKSSDLQVATNGNIITYTLAVHNVGAIKVYDVVVKDLLDIDLEFINGSVTIDSVSYPNASILTGINIASLDINKTAVITFKAKVLDKDVTLINNMATAVYKYKITETDIERVKTVNSNINTVVIETHKLEIIKVADKTVATLNDIINYRVKIENTGKSKAVDIVFFDELPENLKYVVNSFKLNGVVVNNVNLATGVNIGSLAAGEVAIIDYAAKVISGTCSGYSTNKAFANYEYNLSNSATGDATTDIASAEIQINIDSFKQISLDKEFTIPSVKPNMEDVDDVSVNIVIDNSYIVKVSNLTSNEGQILSGTKLIVHGTLEAVVEYTALETEQSMHSAHFSVPFSSFIILPNDYKDGQDVEVSAVVEDVDFTMINIRRLSVSLMLLLVAKIKQ